MEKEIGSEFWSPPSQACDRRFFLSGRTSLAYIARDIRMSGAADCVLLPSYCCHTMIEPFMRHGFSVRFYDVFCSEKESCLCAQLPDPLENEVLYYISYFGFPPISGLNPEELRAKFKIIIDDRTHSWLRRENPPVQSDYAFTSFRKWGAFSGISEACKYCGSFLPQSVEKTNLQYVEMRDAAFGQKADYMAQGGDKALFFRLFGDAEALLEEDYEDYRPSYHALDSFFSTDWKTIGVRRRQNAEILLEGLSGVKEIALPFPALQDADVPLFVPILVEDGRDALRKYLIDHQVYCPVHWPKSELHSSISQLSSALYSTELSLLCDQRYGQEEMKHIVSLIESFYK